MAGAKKEMKVFVRQLRDAGYAVQLRPNGHYEVTLTEARLQQLFHAGWLPQPGRQAVTMPSTPSDAKRGILNARAELRRRLGYQYEERQG